VADIEIRAFGWRFVTVFEKRKDAVEEEPFNIVYNSGGDFGFAPRSPDDEDATWLVPYEEE
jgi:hypothetical protein